MNTNNNTGTANDIRERIVAALAHKRNSGMTLRKLALQTAVSASGISQIMQGKNNPGKKTWTRLEKWLQRQTSGYRLVATENWKKIHAVCHHAMTERVMARILGDTGAGKTTALQRFAAHYEGDETHHIYYIECLDWTQLGFVEALEKTVGVSATGNKIKRILHLRKALRERANALLILDQASAMREFVLRLLHPLFGGYNDNAFGIVLAGTDTLHNVMAGAAQRNKQLMRELNNRVENDYGKLGYPTKAEIVRICQANNTTDKIIVEMATRGVNKYGYACVRKAINDYRFKTVNLAHTPHIPTL